MSNEKHTTSVIGPVRFAFLNIFKPREQLDGSHGYDAVLLIPKEPGEFCDDPKAVGRKLTEMIKNAAGERQGKYDSPLRDGDVEVSGEGVPKFPGYWFVRAKAREEYPPIVIDGQRSPVTARDGWTSGDWGNAKLSCYWYDKSGKRGVGVGLRGIQFLYKDDSFGVADSPEDFPVVEDADINAAANDRGYEEDYDPFSGE
jgi:hypothetical protein